MIEKPGFPERVFEFAFNAEFARKNKAVLMACPDMPTQQEEKKKGYDVKFELRRRGGGRESLFFQHKVARFVRNQAISNKKFFEAADGPYFAFGLDVDQYNLIRTFETRRKERIYYCAPLFTARGRINDLFASDGIVKNCIWIDVKAGPKLGSDVTHSIIYSQKGNQAAVFSEQPFSLQVTAPAEYAPSEILYPRGFDNEEARHLYLDAYHAIEEWRRVGRTATPESRAGTAAGNLHWHRREALLPPPPQDMTENGVVDAIGRLMADFYGLSWLLVGAHDPN